MDDSGRFASLPRRRAGLVVRRIDDEAVVYDPAHHTLCYLNETALYVWDRADGTTRVRDMVASLSGAFAPEPRGFSPRGASAQAKACGSGADGIERHIASAVDTMIERGLLDIVLDIHPSCN